MPTGSLVHCINNYRYKASIFQKVLHCPQVQINVTLFPFMMSDETEH